MATLACASLLACLISASATAENSAKTPVLTPKEQPASSVKTYENKEKNYAIDYPAQWQKKDMPKLDLVLFAPGKEGNTEPQASMNVVSEKVDENVTLDQFYSESISNLTTALKEVQIQKSGDLQLHGTPSKWVIYTHVMQGVKFEVLQYFLVAKDTIYLITFSASAETFNSYSAQFERTAASFRLGTS